MPHSAVGDSHATTSGVRHPPRRILRSVVFLLISTGALLIFIAFLGDWRREHNILAQLRKYAAKYSSRMGEGGALPLNLELDVPRDPRSRLIDAWLSPNETRILRGSSRAILAAWTIRLPRLLGPNGRGVILFENGSFDVKWVPLGQFDASLAEQSAQLRLLAPHPSPKIDSQP